MTNENTVQPSVDHKAIALADKVVNAGTIKPVLPTFGGEELPVTVLFHQEFQKTTYVTYETDVPEIAKDENGEVVKVKEDRQVNGKTVAVYVPKATGKMVTGKVRFPLETMNDARELPVIFRCSKNELRHKIGEAFQQLAKKLAAGNCPLKLSETTNVTLKINGKVISTKTILDGGIKLSKAFYKKELKPELFSERICRPLFQQLQDAERGEANKPLDVSTSILTAIGLVKK